MAYQIESGSCIGRGFDANGFLGKLKTWIVKVAGSGGPGWFIVDDQSAAGTNPYIVVSNVNFPFANANKHKIIRFLMPTGTPGRIEAWVYRTWDASAAHTGPTPMAPYALTTVDGGTFSYDFRGGAECLYVAARDGSSTTEIKIDDWTGDANELEGTSATGTLASGASLINGNASVTVGAGEGANFTPGEYYYIWDGAAFANTCAYVELISKAGDVLTCRYSTTKTIPGGAIISAYHHRFATFGTNLMSASIGGGIQQNNAWQLPYQSVMGFEISGSFAGSGPRAFVTWNDIINVIDPDDKGRYRISPILIYESIASTSLGTDNADTNRSYGTFKNLRMGTGTSLLQWVDNRTVGGVNWLYGSSTNGRALLMRNTAIP